jgi:hypothetical protein
MITVAKLNGKIVQVVRVVDTVRFSDQRGWILINYDLGVREAKVQHVKWLPASTRFDWVREYISVD